MFRILVTRLVGILIMLPILHRIGFAYARIHPSFDRPRFGSQQDFSEYRYFDYLQDIFLRGDLGRVGNVPILDLVSKPFFNSLILILISMGIVTIIGVLLGILIVSPPAAEIRPVGFYLTSIGSSLPGFLLGGAVLASAVYLTLYAGRSSLWIPVSGCGEGTPIPFSSCSLDKHLIVPLLVLAVRPTLHLAKVTSGLLVDEVKRPYVRTVRGKGGRWWRAYIRHAGRNVVSPVLIVIGQSLRWIVSGLLIAEKLVDWPGIGRLFVFAVVTNENFTGQFRFFAHPQLLATLAVLMGLIILTADLLTALANHASDPRLRS